MKKIAFLVESEYGEKHFGVRNYFSTIFNSLEEKYDVDYITYSTCRQGVLWYRVLEDKRPKDIQTDSISITNNRQFSYKKYILNKKIKVLDKKCYYFQYLGTDLENEKYDACIITNPWLLTPIVDIKSPKIIGIVYDLVPNEYSLVKSVPPIDFASEHNIGYEYYNKHCNAIIAISKQTMDQYRRYYSSASGKISFFPPFMPYHFECGFHNEHEIKENSIILAAPFDLRKGLKKIPKLLNPIKDWIDKIYIFGEPRCAISDFDEFFNEIDARIKIVYYPTISYVDLIDLYSKCKVLLFPSKEEGLGLPIIEAQVCGCRPVTTNEEPMNQLTLNGSYLLSDDDEQDSKEIAKMLKEEFDYDELKRVARREFSIKRVIEMIEKII